MFRGGGSIVRPCPAVNVRRARVRELLRGRSRPRAALRGRRRGDFDPTPRDFTRPAAPAAAALRLEFAARVCRMSLKVRPPRDFPVTEILKPDEVTSGNLHPDPSH